MRRHLTCAACVTLFCCAITAHAQQAGGPGQVIRPRAAEAPEGVKVAGCVLPESRPNAFRLLVAREAKGGSGPKLPKGVKAGSSLELVARGESNLQPFANQKIEVTGKLTNGNRRLEVVDARPIGPCDPTAPQPF
jgi:hypothetical protein